jgi:hypothetical protein
MAAVKMAVRGSPDPAHDNDRAPAVRGSPDPARETERRSPSHANGLKPDPNAEIPPAEIQAVGRIVVRCVIVCPICGIGAVHVPRSIVIRGRVPVAMAPMTVVSMSTVVAMMPVMTVSMMAMVSMPAVAMVCSGVRAQERKHCRGSQAACQEELFHSATPSILWRIGLRLRCSRPSNGR